MVSQRLITTAVAAIVPFAVVTALAIPDSAAGPTAVTGAGSITCSYGTTASPVTVKFSPPLTRSPGTLVHATTPQSEIVTLSRASLGTCARTPTPTPKVSGGKAAASITVKIPGVSLGGGKWYVGDCSMFESMSWAGKMTTHFTWSGPAAPLVVSSLATKSSVQLKKSGLLGFVASGKATGSFAGTNSNITAYFNTTSTGAINRACGGNTNKVATATISPTVSTVHLGT